MRGRRNTVAGQGNGGRGPVDGGSFKHWCDAGAC